MQKRSAARVGICILLAATVLRCPSLFVAGIGSSLALIVSVADQVSSSLPSASLDYLAPSITAVSPQRGPTVSATGYQVTITGHNFGTDEGLASLDGAPVYQSIIPWPGTVLRLFDVCLRCPVHLCFMQGPPLGPPWV